MGRVRWGRGMGCSLSTLCEPVPLAWVGGLPTKSMEGFPSEFELRSTVTDVVDLAFYHSYDVPLHSTNVAGCVES